MSLLGFHWLEYTERPDITNEDEDENAHAPLHWTYHPNRGKSHRSFHAELEAESNRKYLG